MNFTEWADTLPDDIKNDSLWKMEAYRIALFVNDIGWHDITRLSKDRRTFSLSDQLYRSLGSVCANLEEGYSRGSNRDRARFYEYALGSARESRGWYYRARFVLGEEVTQHRIGLITEVIRLLLTMVPQQRSMKVRETTSAYSATPSPPEPADLQRLLQHIPFPKKP